MPCTLHLAVIAATAVPPVADRPWPTATGAASLSERVSVPAGFHRLPVRPESFGAWLRGLPLRPGQASVHLYDGSLRTDQTAHVAVLDVDVGSGDLQQCADAVMRLRAEYLWAAGQGDDICFRFTSGHPLWWMKWRKGQRPRVEGNTVRFVTGAGADASYASFRRYLRTVFTYAGSQSLRRELEPVVNPAQMMPGDVFIQGGFPGHAALVIDVAEDRRGQRIFLLAQSYMPAQDIHILKNPRDPDSPWYRAEPSGALPTPDWLFSFGDLARFSSEPCSAPGGAATSERIAR